MRRFVFLMTLLGVLFLVAASSGWLFWTERYPEAERELRVIAQERLETWFPEAMSLPPGQVGFVPRGGPEGKPGPDVVLIHGLDEPGGIWDDLVPELVQAGWVTWEFRYPNDQAIDHSADLLAEYWEELEATEPVVLIGHSMGGLVIRDFVTRWRHLEDAPAAVTGPKVGGVILVGTPNQGSEWARLRGWLEVREWFVDVQEGRFSLWAGLRDGTGAAKIDLRPDSGFLSELNARAWPEDIPVCVIGGRITEPTPEMRASLDALSEDLGIEDLDAQVEAWWSSAGEAVGDGAVPLASLHFEGAPEPVILPASHRGLLVRMPFTDDAPPAIEVIVDRLGEWRESQL